MLFLLLGEVHPLIFHQVPTSQMSNKFSTSSWNIHTHNTHLPMVCEKQYEVVVWTHLRKYACQNGQLRKLGWIIWRYQIFLNPHQQKWILQLSFHQSSGSYHGNPPKNHSFCQKKETASRQGSCGKAPLNMAHLLSLGVFILHFLPVPRSRPAFCSRSLSKIPAARVERCDGLLLGDGRSWSCRSLYLILEVGHFVGTCVSHGVFEKQLADITPTFIYHEQKKMEHLWKLTVANMEHELPLKHVIAPCSFNTSFLAGNLGLGVCNFPFFCVLRTLAAVHISTASLEKYHLFFTTKTGVSILPTQTRHYYRGNPSKLPCICILSWLIPPNG